MPGSHVAIALSDGSSHSHVAVLPVHVVSTTARVVPQPDAKVLHFGWCLVVDTTQRDDLSAGLLHLLQLASEVPVPGLGDNFVRGEDHHLVEGRAFELLGRQRPSDNLVLFELQRTRYQSDNMQAKWQ